MRRDICCFYNRPVHEVYHAYLAAVTQLFDKNPSPRPYHTIGFGLKWSFKYNMNGGGCNVHLMPYNGGTAVNVRYTIAQAVGAKYSAHCQEMTRAVEQRLQTASSPLNVPVEQFLLPQNQVTSAPTQPAASVAQPAAPAPQPSAPPAQAFKFCTACGTRLEADARFCSTCGKPQA